jgi:hypothetical protein
LLVIPELLAPSMALALRAAYGVRVCNPANTVVQRYPESSAFEFRSLPQETMDYAPLLRRAFQAIGFADVRFGILPAQSRFCGNDG